MSQSTNLRRRPSFQTLLILITIFLALIASRLPLVLTAAHGSELTTDEADLSLMALDRYFGVPLTNTHWPALTNQMLMVPLIGVDFALGGHPKTASGFAGYAGIQYRDPTPLVVMHRALVVVLVSLATAALAWTLRSRGWLVAIGATLLLQNVHLITYGTLGLGNGPALAAMIGVAACLLHDGCRRKRSLMAGLLFGVALASRNTSVLLAPLVLGFAWEMSDSRRQSARYVTLIVVGAMVGGSPAWVHASLEPIRWAKANLGNFIKVGPPVGLRGALGVLLNTSGLSMWAATAASMCRLIAVRRHRAIVVGWVASYGVAVVISARSPLVETRYFDAIVLGAIVLCVLAMEDLLVRNDPLARRSLRERMEARPMIEEPRLVDASRSLARSDRTAVGVLIVSSLLALIGIVGATRRFDASRAGLRPDDRAVAASLTTNGRVIVDRSLLGLFRLRATSASLRGLADQTEAAMIRGDALGEFVARFKLSPDVAAVFTPDLTEKEQCEVIRTRVAAAAAPIGEPLDVSACGDSNSARRYGVMSVAEAIAQVRDRRAAEAIVPAESIGLSADDALAVEPLGSGRFVRVRRHPTDLAATRP